MVNKDPNVLKDPSIQVQFFPMDSKDIRLELDISPDDCVDQLFRPLNST